MLELLDKLTVDEILIQNGITHLKLRRWIHRNRKQQYDVTEGLAQDILVEALTPTEARRKYFLTSADIQKVFYANHVKQAKVSKNMVKLYHEKGFTMKEIASLLGCSYARISQILRELDLNTTRKKRIVLKEHQREEIKELVKTMPQKDVAKKYGIAAQTVSNIVNNRR